MTSERGKYIVIEGNDGTGKSTQVELLAEHLKAQGIASFVTHEPAGTPVADEIRRVIVNGELERDAETNLLLFTAARHEIWQRAKQELALGRWVLSARNYLSTIAYQGYGEGLDKGLIMETTRTFTGNGYLSPNHTIILTLPDSERERRIGQRGALEVADTFEQRGTDFQDKVNRAYDEIAIKYGYPTIDASQTIKEIQDHIRQLVGPV